MSAEGTVLQAPSPSHRRDKSLDDIVYANDRAAYNMAATTPAASGSYNINSRQYQHSPHHSQSRTCPTSGPTELDNMYHHKPKQHSITALMSSNEELQRALEFEENETIRLEKLLKESRQKCDSSLLEQSKLEQDVVDRDNQIVALQRQLKDMKRSKHELENTLTEEQMTYINEKKEWLDKEQKYERKLKEAQGHASNGSMTPGPISAPSPSPTPPVPSTPQTPAHNLSNKDQKLLERMRSELDVTKQQLELVSKEYALRHEQVKQEVESIKEVNTRLQEENEGFQVLLAQKTVMGEFSLQDELEDFHFDAEDSVVVDAVDDGEHEHEREQRQGQEQEQEQEAKEKQEKDGETQRKLYNLEFETKSLKNHNKSLKLALERLVQRLLEYREFESVVQDSQQDITQRSISFFSRRVSNSNASVSSSPLASKQRSQSYAPLDVPKQRRQSNLTDISAPQPHYHHQQTGSLSPASLCSTFQFPGASRGSNRALKPAATWSSMILGTSNSSNRGSESREKEHDGLDSPVSTASSTTNTEIISSASSIDSSDITSVLNLSSNSSTPRPVIHGQKKLRPLKLQPAELVDQPPLQSASSTWSFGLTSSSST